MFYIKSIKLNNFRCYDTKSIDFSPNINIIYGQNAVGKTSILESIAYLGLLKSFRDAKDGDLIKNDESYFFINGKFVEDEDNNVVDITASYNDKGKHIKKNSYIYQKNSDYIGYFNVVSFDPSDLELVKGAKALRRRFLNINISQIDKEYMLSIIRYNKILKKRNDYLKNEDKKDIDLVYLDTLTTMLAKEAKYIIRKRSEFLNELNPYIKECSLKMTGSKEEVELIFSPNSTAENVEKEYRLKEKYDIAAKKTTIGPHRDDILVLINKKDASIYASQGQIRTAVISIKLALSEYMKKMNNKQIILLDDVFSELDMQRQEDLLNILSEKNQIFITSTGIEHINQAILSKSNLIEFRRGEGIWVFLRKKKTIS